MFRIELPWDDYGFDQCFVMITMVSIMMMAVTAMTIIRNKHDTNYTKNHDDDDDDHYYYGDG